jgi:hypothetical protein
LGVGRLQQWLQALKQAGPKVERRLASLRLHLPEWGTDACSQTPHELVATADVRCDVRLSAALLALCEAAPLATSREELQSGAGGSSRGNACTEGPAQLIGLRARQLLGAFPTTADEDAALLALGRVGGAVAEAVAYRRAKKRVLACLAKLEYGEDAAAL